METDHSHHLNITSAIKITNEKMTATGEKLYHPSEAYKRSSHISSFEEYERLYRLSVENPVKFWRDIAISEFYWKIPPSEKDFMRFNFDPSKGNVFVEWMKGAKTNICYNGVDRIIEQGHGEKVAYIWEGNEPGEEKQITYKELKNEVSKFSNVLKSFGIQKGSRVAIYMPVTIELVIAMLGCARIGAVHTVVFAGFSAEALADRMVDAKCSVLVTADGYYRGNKLIQLKEIAADALEKCYTRNNRIRTCIVHRRINLPVIVTGNGSIVSSHLPNGQDLIRKQTGPNVVAGLMQNHRLSNNNNINNNHHTNNNNTIIINNINNNSLSNTTTTTTTTTTNNTNNINQQEDKNINNENNNGCTGININNNNNLITKKTTNNNNNNSIEQQQQLLIQTGLEDKCPLKAISWNYAVDVWWDHCMAEASPDCEPVWVDAEDPLFILYTSGSTGKPKGVVHTTGGYMVYAATTFKYVFNYNGDDVFFCTADLGWITGHTVNVYGSLCNGTTVTLFEGTPFHPDPGRLWQIVDRHQVNTFYTAPTAIRSLMKFSDAYVTNSDRSSLKLLGTAGEPINPEAWDWYFDRVGGRQCPIVDTFWQTETSAPMLTPLPGATPLKPGSATFPFFGVQPAVVDEDGKELEGAAVGHLVFKAPWPGMMRTIDGDHGRFEDTYFSIFPGYYATGDHVRRDSDGYYWVLGRADDMLNVSGHLLSTAEVESALMEHRAVVEAAAVSYPHDIKGQAIFCYVVLRDEYDFSENIEKELRSIVRHKIGALASPERIMCLKQLPKTRSGKTMRRILRKASMNDFNLGDISTIADQSALYELFPSGFNGTCERTIQI